MPARLIRNPGAVESQHGSSVWVGDVDYDVRVVLLCGRRDAEWALLVDSDGEGGLAFG
jgi:hypothetical protein